MICMFQYLWAETWPDDPIPSCETCPIRKSCKRKEKEESNSEDDV